MRKRFIFAALSAFALLSASCAQQQDNTLKVMSFNIRNGEADDAENSWVYRAEAAAAMVNDQAPDIFGVQEAYDYQVASLLQNCPDYEAVGVGREDGVSEGEHMSIFWRNDNIECLDWGTFWLSETPEVPSCGWDGACKRTATWAYMEIKSTSKKFLYVNTHLDHVGRVAEMEGLKLIMSRLDSLNDGTMPTIITGDFNVEQDSPVLADINARMHNARLDAEQTDDHYSFNDWGDERSWCVIDYIFYEGFERCSKFETVTDEYLGKKYVSDHFPVTAILHY